MFVSLASELPGEKGKSSYLHKHSSTSPSCATLPSRTEIIPKKHDARSQTAQAPGTFSNRPTSCVPDKTFFLLLCLKSPLTAFTAALTPCCEAGGYSWACALDHRAELKSALWRSASGSDKILSNSRVMPEVFRVYSILFPSLSVSVYLISSGIPFY